MKYQKGLSLVELMVALTLSLVLMAGVMQIFTSNKKTFEITHDLGMMQENGRVAISLISDSIRMADHWTGVEASDVTFGAVSLPTAPAGCAAAWVFDSSFPLRGYEGESAIGSVADFPANCISNSDYQPNTDILVLRYADGREMTDDADVATVDNQKKYYVRTAVGQTANVFQGVNAAAAITSIPLDDAVYNMGYGIDMYFIRQCSIQVSGVCKDSIPTLVRLSLNEDRFEQEVLIEGVEQLQFEYGIDEDGDLDVDEYESASTLGSTVDDWAAVMSVRVSVMVRSADKDLSVDDSKNDDGSAKVYLLVGDMSTSSTGYTVAAADRQYRRKQYQREIHVRNRGRL